MQTKKNIILVFYAKTNIIEFLSTTKALVSLNMTRPAIGIDLGGSHATIAVVEGDKLLASQQVSLDSSLHFFRRSLFLQRRYARCLPNFT